MMLLIIPVILALPIVGAIHDYISSQNCQEWPQELRDSCCCASKTTPIQENSCCCAKSKPKSSDNISYVTVYKTTEYSFDLSFDFLATFVDEKEKNDFVYNRINFSADIIPSDNFVFYFPPIYQQNCSLRI